MKKFINSFTLCFALFGMLMITSCGDDGPVIGPGGDGLNLADGTYLQAGDADPLSSAGLVSEEVEAEGFATQERTGFAAGYMWLDAGSYSIVTVVDREITSTIGGTMSSVTDDGSSCDFNDYMVVMTEEDGPAFNVATSGLYKVTHDAMTNEMTLYNTSDVSIIGSATEGGWGADTPLTGSVTSDGGSWSASGVILRSGEFKMRFNCRWGINRRIDPGGSLDDPANGYQLFTNFGGSTADLVLGGSNIQQEEDGEYTVTADWSPQNGWTIDAERTGDAPVINFNPNDFQMAVIGDATPMGWDADRNLFHKEENGVNTWYGVVTFSDTGFYKFRANDAWDFNLGGDLAALSNGGADIATPGAGGWYITLSTADEGESWTSTVTENDWSIIGEGGPNMDWQNDVPMNSDGVDADGNSVYSLTGDFTEGNWKFRAGNDWPLNLGGDFSFLTLDGSDLTTGSAGTFTVTLRYDGEVYTASIQ
jgi:hypothetical protein